MAYQLTIALFGITRDIVGASSLTLFIEKSTAVDHLLAHLRVQYPRLEGLNSLLVAINSEYAEGNQVIQEGDEIALIPPVSGG